MNTFRSASLVAVTALVCHAVLAQDFYPLQVGNTWFYRSITQAPGDSSIMSSFRVVGDSLFANGHRYFVLDSVDIMEARFIRRDSAYVCYLDPATGQDRKVFNLNARVGETAEIHLGVYTSVRLVSTDSMEVFGLPDRVLSYRLDGLVSPSPRKISRRFGPLYEERFTDGPPPWPYYGRQLVGCTIGGNTYGRTLDAGPAPAVANDLALEQNFPNPFNPGTTIAFSLNSASEVTLVVSDLLGRQVRVLVHGPVEAGHHTIGWDGRNGGGEQMSSGVYFYELRSHDAHLVRRMFLLK